MIDKVEGQDGQVFVAKDEDDIDGEEDEEEYLDKDKGAC